MTLDDAISTLYAREINCGCETFWDGGIAQRPRNVIPATSATITPSNTRVR
jgi:hypothetical protein